MDTPREIELKLDCTGPDLAALGAHPLLQGHGEGQADGHGGGQGEAGASEPKLLAATYYDTADGALRAADLTLRVRRTGETPSSRR